MARLLPPPGGGSRPPWRGHRPAAGGRGGGAAARARGDARERPRRPPRQPRARVLERAGLPLRRECGPPLPRPSGADAMTATVREILPPDTALAFEAMRALRPHYDDEAEFVR